MAESFNDAVFRLPSQVVADDDVSLDEENAPVNNKDGLEISELIPGLCFPTEFPYEFDSLDSALSTPVESVIGSTETDTTSDEEDFLAGLTRRLTQSSTQKLAVPAVLTQNRLESWVVAGSPESTLSGIGSWSVSSNGSPSGPSLVSSPTTPFRGQNDTWDLISAAAGQVAKLKMSNNTTANETAAKYNTTIAINNSHSRGLLVPTKSSSPVHVMKNPNFGFYAGQSVYVDLANTNQYQQYVKQNNTLKAQCGSVRGRQQVRRQTWPSQSQPQQIQNKVRNLGYENARSGRPLVQQQAQSAWPLSQVQHQHQHQHQHHHQQRPAFLGGSVAAKRECAGTGVFLPRRYGNNASDSRKKLVPAKVVQATNLNFNNINCNSHAQQRFNGGLGPNYDALIARRNALITLQRRSLRPDAAPKHEIHLPQEWTY